jgi:hypothetical protein
VPGADNAAGGGTSEQASRRTTIAVDSRAVVARFAPTGLHKTVAAARQLAGVGAGIGVAGVPVITDLGACHDAVAAPHRQGNAGAAAVALPRLPIRQIAGRPGGLIHEGTVSDLLAVPERFAQVADGAEYAARGALSLAVDGRATLGA